MSAALRFASLQARALSLRLNYVSVRHQATCALVSVAAGSSVSSLQAPRSNLLLAQHCAVKNGLSSTMSLSSPLSLASKVPVPPSFQYQQTRTLAIKGLIKKKKTIKVSAKKKHEKKMKLKAVQNQENSEVTKQRDQDEVSVKHRQWVEFQKSITVHGFETGQITQVIAGHTKGRQARAQRRVQRLMQKRVESKREQLKAVKTGEFPALRLSDEETERLLAEAKSYLPPRTGKRGTRNLKRQSHRWWLVRQIHKKAKKQKKAAKRRKRVAKVKTLERIKTLRGITPVMKMEDRNYQLETFRRWAALMKQQKDDEWEDVEDGGEVVEGQFKSKM